jgi:hypothetical protein
MELGVRVNAVSDHEAEDMPLDGFEWPSVNIHGLKQARKVPRSGRLSMNPSDQPSPKPPVPNRAFSGDFGPCLYFGPAGQRCDRRATRDGFCQRHQPGIPTISAPFLTPKKLAAFLIALAMLWPELTKFLSALARLLR